VTRENVFLQTGTNRIQVLLAENLTKIDDIVTPGPILNMFGTRDKMHLCGVADGKYYQMTNGVVQFLNYTSLISCHIYGNNTYYVGQVAKTFSLYNSNEKMFEFFDEEYIGAVDDYLVLSKTLLKVSYDTWSYQQMSFYIHGGKQNGTLLTISSAYKDTDRIYLGSSYWGYVVAVNRYCSDDSVFCEMTMELWIIVLIFVFLTINVLIWCVSYLHWTCIIPNSTIDKEKIHLLNKEEL
jgi:hypothetical protein